MIQEEWVTGKVSLQLYGEPVEMEMTVPATPIKPHRLFPILQQMTNAFVDAGVSRAEADGKSISCKAGCGACCRQAVPISEIEVYQIAELVESMPEPRRSEIKKRFADGMAHFRSISWFERMDRANEIARREQTKETAYAAIDIVLEYFREGIPCPFLENESCSIHESRPLGCREFLVTSPAENCKSPSADTIDRVEPGLKVSKAIRSMASSSRMKELGMLTLIRALELAEEVPEQLPEKPGPEWLSDFFAFVNEQTAAAQERAGNA